MYVAVKGGERAIENAHRLLAQERRGDPAVPELSLEQIEQQLTLAVDRVMNEGSLYDRELAALAIKQARGDLIEAIFLLRAFRATLPRFGMSEPIDTGAMAVSRRISSTSSSTSLSATSLAIAFLIALKGARLRPRRMGDRCIALVWLRIGI